MLIAQAYLSSFALFFWLIAGENRHIWEERPACGQVHDLQRGHAHPERPSRPQVRAVPVQLPPHLQKHQSEDRMSATQLQTGHQPRAHGGRPFRLGQKTTLRMQTLLL